MQIEPRLKQISSFKVSGMTVRTSNSKESNPDTAKLGKHWHKFFSEELVSKIPDKLDDSSIYGVYSNYESDFNGHYDVTAGVSTSAETEQADFSSINIDRGNYLVFENKGVMPNAVIDAWKAVWIFFETHPQIHRKYTTDFEVYRGANEVSVYIGVNKN
jgi:predicted transcriptional regulator YdeE